MTRLPRLARCVLLCTLLGSITLCDANAHVATPIEMAAPDLLAAAYDAQVDRRLHLPDSEAQYYGRLVEQALVLANIALIRPQFIVAIDRSPNVQAALLFWMPISGESGPRLIGASPVSTGRPGQFDHFETPLGVFAHTYANPDFRAEGTRNALGIRGYGLRGMRVFDLGWQHAERGWGKGGVSEMRLQMHATDPGLEQWLGSVRSKGCIRIPATLNRLLDHYAVLDSDYEYALAMGARLWVLPPDQQASAGSGQFIVVLDSGRTERPAWSPAPTGKPAPASPRITTRIGND